MRRHQEYHETKMLEVERDSYERVPSTISDQMTMEYNYGYGQYIEDANGEPTGQMQMRDSDFQEAKRHRVEVDRYEDEYYAEDEENRAAPFARGPLLGFEPTFFQLQGNIWDQNFDRPDPGYHMF